MHTGYTKMHTVSPPHDRAVADNVTGARPSEPEVEVTGLEVCRPSLFLRADVAGLTEATTVLTDGRPVGRWLLCLQWAGGTRQVLPLPEWVDRPSGGRLWLAPFPAAPHVGVVPSWSPQGRERWLQGESPRFDELFHNLCDQIGRFIVFPEEDAAGALATVALWTMLTYCYPAWAAVPYLHVAGTLASGKSRLLDVLSRLVRRPIMASSMTAGVLFRTLHEHGGTLLLDEAERLGDQSASSELRTVLLAGYRAGGRVARLRAHAGEFRPVHFDVFGPKALGGIGELPPALASRCIRVSMLRTAGSNAQVRASLDADVARWQQLRDDIHALILARATEILSAAQTADDLTDGLSGRDAELWRPLLVLARLCDSGGSTALPECLRAYADAVVADSQDDTAPEPERILVGMLAASVANQQSDVTPKELLGQAQKAEPAAFRGWTPHRVASALRRYGLHTAKTSGGRRSYRQLTGEHIRRVTRLYGFSITVENASFAPHATAG
jgi:hypothetical protein